MTLFPNLLRGMSLVFAFAASAASAAPAGPGTVVPAAPTASSGPDDQQTVDGWDASELSGPDGSAVGCLIRQHYVVGTGKKERQISTFFSVSRSRGLMLLLKDTGQKLKPGQTLTAELTLGGRRIEAITVQAASTDEIVVAPADGNDLAAALDGASTLDFRSRDARIEAPIPPGVFPWLKACAVRNGIGFKPGVG